jgi:preprotein translocase subunit SecD
MNTNLRWKLILILAVVAIAVYAFYPPREKVKLGLDLKGGVHLVLRAHTDDALRLETETAAERLRQQLRERGITVGSVQVVDAMSFRVDGVPPDKDAEFRRLADDETAASFNRSSSVNSYTFRLRDPVALQLRREAVRQALQTIERRVNELGVAEPIVAEHGSAGDQILVQLPGVTDVQRAKDIIRSTAVLELKLVEDGPAASREALLATRNSQLPPDMEVLSGTSEISASGERPETVYYLVRKAAVVRGNDLRNARPTLDSNNQPAVNFQLSREGARKFGTATGENVGRRLAIILDGRVQSAPVINSRIDTDGIIEGSFTNQEVTDLALKLRSGALPISLTYLEERTVGPSLGADSIRAGLLASVGGLQADRDQRHRICADEPGHPARVHGVHRRDDDAARRRGIHPDDRDGRRLERADLRAHQRGARRGQGRPCRGRRRIRSRLPHDSRHARRVAHRRRVPLPVRDWTHSRICDDAVFRTVVQRLHGGVRLAVAL